MPRHVAGAVIGGTVGLCALVGGPLSGAALNPARWLGPALLSGSWQHAWIYLVGPLAGALVGAWGYGALIGALPHRERRVTLAERRDLSVS